jgi:hypothetical protein
MRIRLRRAGAGLLCAAALLSGLLPGAADTAAAASAMAAGYAGPTGAPVPMPIGVNVHQTAGPALAAAGAAGMRWARADALWSQVEPAPGAYDFAALDAFIAEARGQGFSILLDLSSAPAWASASGRAQAVPDTAAWAGFVSAIASRYAGQVAAIGVWNEPNGLTFFDGTAGDYTDALLRPAYAAVRAADPSMLVVGGEVATSTGVPGADYLRALSAAGAMAYLDVVGFHVYADTLAEFESLVVRDLAAVPPGVRVFIDEFGHDSAVFGESAQAGYLTGAVRFLAATRAVDAAFVYELRDKDAAGFGLLRADLSPKPALAALAAVIAALPDAPPAPALSLTPYRRAIAASFTPAPGQPAPDNWLLEWSIDRGATMSSLLLPGSAAGRSIPFGADGLPVIVRASAVTGGAAGPPAVAAGTVLPKPYLAASAGIRTITSAVTAPASADWGTPSRFAFETSGDGGSTWRSWTSASPSRTMAGAVDGVSDGRLYLVRARALYGAAWGPYADAAAVRAMPGAPVLTAVPGLRSVSASWSWAAQDTGLSPTGFRFFWSTDGGARWDSLTTAASAAAVPGLADGQPVLMRVAALFAPADYAQGTGQQASAQASALLLAAPQVAATGGSRSVAVSWTAASGGAYAVPTAYRVFWSANGGASYLSSTVYSGTAYTVSGLPVDAPVLVQVAAIYAGFLEGPRGSAAARTAGFSPTAPAVVLRPTASGVTASWTLPVASPADAPSGWRVSWRSSDGSVSGSADLAAAASFLQVLLPSPDMPVEVSVAALYTLPAGMTAGPAGTAASASLPAASLAAAGGDHRITASASAPPSSVAGPPTAYAIGVSADGGATWSTFSGVSPSLTAAGLLPGTAYLVRAAARFGPGPAGWSAWTAPVVVSTAP